MKAQGFGEGAGENFAITGTFASHIYGAAELHDRLLERQAKRWGSKAHMDAVANWAKALRDYEVQTFGHVGTFINVKRDWTGTRSITPELPYEEIVKITPLQSGHV